MTSTELASNNAKTTLAGAITNTATSCAVQAGTGALFPVPGASQYFRMTFNDAATGLLFEIVFVTSVSGDTFTITRGEEGTTALNWIAGDIATNFFTAGSFENLVQTAQLPQGIRTAVSGTLNLYVSTTGSDSNTGLSSGSPFLTPQYAYNYLCNKFDCAGNPAIINFADGTYTSGINAILTPLDCSGVTILGDTATPSNVIFNITNGTCFGTVGAAYEISGVTLQASGTGGGQGTAVSARTSGVITIGPDVIFGACAVVHMTALRGGTVLIGSPYTVSGSAPIHLDVYTGSILFSTSLVVTVSGTPAFSTAYANATMAGTIDAFGMTFTGSATGPRYSASLNGVINTYGGGANYFPGGSAGSTATGGQYV